MSKTGYKEHPSELMDINSIEDNALGKNAEVNTMLYEDIVKGVATEKQHEMWLRVKKMGWSYREAADFFECTVDNVNWTLKEIEKKVKGFRINVRQRGGYIFK
jgi:hypothetical protein